MGSAGIRGSFLGLPRSPSILPEHRARLPANSSYHSQSPRDTQREKESETESEKQRNETDGNREVGKRATVIYPEWGRYERHARGEGGRQRQKRGSPDAEVKIYPVSPVHRPGSRAQRGLVLCPRPPRKLVAESDLVCGPADSWLFSL